MSEHITVLKQEAIDCLSLKPNHVVIDATLGGGGHALEIVSRLGVGGTLLALDVDQVAITKFLESQPQGKSTILTANSNFKEITKTATELGISYANAILADLGWRSEQFLGSEGVSPKGFSFLRDEPLLMTYGNPADYLFTAYEVVNEWDEENIADVIYGYGEEPRSRVIAKAIVEERKERPIESSKVLGDLIQARVRKSGKIHPATKTFQALRMVVNDELKVLESFIEQSMDLLADCGRLAIITFHSLEDRVVKQSFRKYAHDQEGKLVNKKVITAQREEVVSNPRARSAKLRVIEKNGKKQ